MRGLCAVASTEWAPFRFAFKRGKAASEGAAFDAAAGGLGGVEIACPFHKKNNRTGCKKEMNVREKSTTGIEATLWALKHWSTKALDCRSQREHLGPRRIDPREVPPPQTIVANRVTAEPPENVVADDDMVAQEVCGGTELQPLFPGKRSLPNNSSSPVFSQTTLKLTSPIY